MGDRIVLQVQNITDIHLPKQKYFSNVTSAHLLLNTKRMCNFSRVEVGNEKTEYRKQENHVCLLLNAQEQIIYY